ncbi:adenine deaminase C-terminal domain-containing protein [Sedimentibacter sp. B4]|uniref:adenine deaminase C-terminal domain-containing protein n=1 Tax=Sedimentibacter sp. B4 TaxID=304766 RepID=UPI00030AF9B1|nr:adenine deaminase C-terminal domain-containing protein [Sedimentibacter sp. B4]
MKADIIFYNAQVFNVFLKKFEKKNIAVKDGRFFWVHSGQMAELEAESCVDMHDKFIIPGLIDVHMHIESSMTTPLRFSEAAIRWGTTTAVADAHEIANVAGLEGLQSFADADTVLDIFYAVPSSVPSTNETMETTGGKIGKDETIALLNNKNVICLGEVMDFNGLVNDENSVIKGIVKTFREQKPNFPVEGHIPRVEGLNLARFLFEGINSDHTQQSPESIAEKVSSGVFLQFQKKSVSKENMDVVAQNNFCEYGCFVTDDVMADDLRNGHLNDILKLAVHSGLPVETAIYMCTYTPARHMGLRDRGCIAPGKIADMVVLDSIDDFSISSVYKNGKIVNKIDCEPQAVNKSVFPDMLYKSIKCRELTTEDLRIKVTDDRNVKEAVCNIIEIEKFGTFTRKTKRNVPVVNGILNWEKLNLSLLIVMERYGKTGQITFALTDILKSTGAVGTTWAHDHHNLMVMGTDPEDMVTLQHKLLKEQGGYGVCVDNEITAFCHLPIGGIISDEPIEILGENLSRVRQGMIEMGYENSNAVMSFATLSLPVSPTIKVTDKGIFHCLTQEKIPLVEELI